MGLKRYVLKRLGQLAMTYWAFITILFGLFRIMPGDPTAKYVMSGLSGEQRQQTIESMGLNDPLHIQYLKYMDQLLHFNFGRSFTYRKPVEDIIVIKFWNTIFLMASALILAFAIGIIVGAALAWWRGTRFEAYGIVITLVTRSVPIFVTAIFVLYLFALQFDLFPVGRMRSVGAAPSTFGGRYWSVDFLKHLILPVLAAIIYYASVPTLLMRNTMLEVLGADFIEMKKAEGIPLLTILYKHAARNSILPIVTLAAVVAGTAMGGQVLLEVVFNWPGMGRAMIDAVNNNDYPLAQATFFLMGSTVIFFNLVADLAYAYLDPRVTYE